MVMRLSFVQDTMLIRCPCEPPSAFVTEGSIGNLGSVLSYIVPQPLTQQSEGGVHVTVRFVVI